MDKNKVYVGNLSWNTTQEGIKKLFEQAGTVTEAKLITDRDTGRSKGFAFVTFADDSMAERAISEFNDYELDGRPLRVSVAENKPREKSDRQNRPRGNNRGFNTPRSEQEY